MIMVTLPRLYVGMMKTKNANFEQIKIGKRTMMIRLRN